MAVRKLLAGAGVGAVLAFGVLVSPAQAAPAQAPAPVPDVGILSCPGGEPPAWGGFGGRWRARARAHSPA
ncbi:hypothetical protein ACFW15_25555, partial [Streptomyces sp. NPDC058953]